MSIEYWIIGGVVVLVVGVLGWAVLDALALAPLSSLGLVSGERAKPPIYVYGDSFDPTTWVTKEEGPEPFPFPPEVRVTRGEFDRFEAIEAAARTYHKTGSETARKRLGRALGVKE